MSLKNPTPVTDVVPWPHGHKFAGASAWWDHVLNKDEQARLDNLMGIALLDEGVRNRLVKDRDHSLLSAFGLSEETQARLRAIPAGSLVELAQALVVEL